MSDFENNPQDSNNAAEPSAENTWNAATPNEQNTWNAANPNEQNTWNAANPNEQNTWNAANPNEQNTWNAANPNEQNTWNAANPNEQNTWNAANPNEQNTWNAASPNAQNTWNAANPNTYNSSTQIYNVNQKKKKPVWAFVLVGLVAVLGICSALVLFVPTLRNSFDLITLSPASYYKKVETRGLNKRIDKFTEELKESSSLFGKDLSYNFDETIKFGDLYQMLLMEGRGASEKFNLDEIGINGSYNKKDGRYSVSTGIAINKTQMASLDFYIDENYMLYARIPEISDNYVCVDLEELMEEVMSDDSNESLQILQGIFENLSKSEIDYDLLNSILKRYAGIIIENAGEIKREKGVMLSDDYLKAKTTEITVGISEKDFYNIVLAVVIEMKDDSELLSFINKIYPVSDEQYKSLFDKLLTELKDTDIEDLDTEDEVIFTVWTDSTGSIVGRGLAFEGYKLSAVNISSKNEMGCQLKFTATQEDVSLTIGGLLEKKDGGYNGTLNISAGYQRLDMSIGEIVIDNYYYNSRKDYEVDATLIIKESTLKMIAGESAFPEGVQGDIQISMKYSAKGDKLTMDYAYGFGSPDNFMSVHAEGELGNAIDVTMPTKAFKIPEEIEEYKQTINLENLIRNFGNAIGISKEEIDDALNDLQNNRHDNPGIIDDTDFDVIGDHVAPDDTDTDYDDNNENYNDDLVNEIPKEAPTTKDQLPPGVEVEDNGYYSYNVTKEAVEKSGLSDDNTHFNITYDEVESKIISILSKYIGQSSVIENQSDNYVSGILDENYPYQHLNFVTINQISNDENAYKNSISIHYDTGSKELESIVIITSDAETCDSIAEEIIPIVEPGFTKADMAKIKKDIEADQFGSTTYNSTRIYFFSMGSDYNTYTISPSYQ